MFKLSKIKMNFIVLLMFILSVVIPTYSIGSEGSAFNVDQEEITTNDKVVEGIKGYLKNMDSSKFQKLMKKHYKQLRLIDSKGRWSSRLLAKKSEFLLPDDISNNQLDEFIDEINKNVEKNPYLMNFMHKIEGKKFHKLERNVKKEGSEEIPSIVAFAFMLERLTKAMYKDHRVLEACMNIWKKERDVANVYKHMNLFEHAKLFSVERFVEEFIDFHKKGKVPPKYGKFLLPLNIFEAMLEDFRLGVFGNAKCAWDLGINSIGSIIPGKISAEGPTEFSKDLKAILLKNPLPKKWDDLYQTWNLAFVSHYPNFPYFMAKLLIPQVSGYSDDPDAYLYNRILALYIYGHYEIIGRTDHAKNGTKPIDWSNKDLTKIWSDVNAKNAKSYTNDLKELNLFDLL